MPLRARVQLNPAPMPSVPPKTTAYGPYFATICSRAPFITPCYATFLPFRASPDSAIVAG